MYEVIDYVLKKQLELLESKRPNDCDYIGFISDDELDWIDGENAALMFGRVKYKRNEEMHFWQPMLLKLTPQVINFPEFHAYMFINEAFFFTRIVPFFERLKPMGQLFPKFYTSYIQMGVDDDKYLLVFENLKNQKYHSSRKKSFLDLNHLKLMMKKLGQLHAYSYKARRENRDQFLSLATLFKNVHFTSIKKMQGLLSALAIRGIAPLCQDENYSSKLAGVEEIAKNADNFVAEIFNYDEWNDLAVLCHGDYTEKNVLFRYENGVPVSMKFVDMTSMKLASPVIDLALLLYINADQNMRNAHWDELIDDYYNSLRETFPETAPPKQDILKEFSTKSLIAYFRASYVLCQKISEDRNMSNFSDMLPHEYKGFGYSDIPLDVTIPIKIKLGGAEATKALTDILKDMIDRGFV